MTTYDTFERDLAASLRQYVADAPIDVEPVALTRAIAVAHPRRPGLAYMFGLRRQYMWLLLAGLLILALLAALAVGLRPPVGGTGLLAFERDGNIYLADSDSGVVVTAIDHDVPFTLGGWSPDGSHLAVAANLRTYLLDPSSLALAELPGLPDGPFGFVSWSPDGRYALTRGSLDRATELHLVDVESGTAQSLDDHCLPVWAPDGQSIAAIARGSDELMVIDVATGDQIRIGRWAGYGCGWSTGWDAPTWSPDSDLVAFVSAQDHAAQPLFDAPDATTITIVRRDGSDSRELTDTAGAWPRPLWSPDGEFISYRTRDGLSVIRPDGTGGRQLVDFEVDRGRISWTADSSRIEFGKVIESERSGGYYGLVELWTVDVETGIAERVEEAGPPVLFFARQPTSRERPAPGLPQELPTSLPDPGIALQSPAAGGQPANPGDAAAGLAYDLDPLTGLCDAVIDWFDGGPSTRFAALCVEDASAGWSAGGGAYASFCGDFYVTDSGTIVITARDGKQIANVTEAGVGDRMEWSPAGGWLSFRTCCRTGRSEAEYTYLILRPDATGLREVPGDPSWSPNDQRIAVASPDGKLLIGSPDGSDLRPIGAFPPPAAWSPDSSRFAYLTGGDVWIANADGTEVRNLTQFGMTAAATAVSWSPTGALLAVVHGDVVWVLSEDGSEQHRVSFAGLHPRSATWSPNGRRLSIVMDDEVVLVEVGTLQAVLLERAAGAVWSPDGSMLALGTFDSSVGATGIDIVRADGTGRVLVVAGNGPITGMQWVP